MARANGKPRGRPPHKNSKAALPMPGDEQVGGWSQAQLIRMDHRFRARLLRAFESGKENRQAAAATYHAIRALERALRNGGEAQEAAGARLSEAMQGRDEAGMHLTTYEAPRPTSVRRR